MAMSVEYVFHEIERQRSHEQNAMLDEGGVLIHQCGFPTTELLRP